MVGPILAPDAEATARPAAAPQPLRLLAAPSRRTCGSSPASLQPALVPMYHGHRGGEVEAEA